ncbi:alpha-ketoglutarate-dependent dioxygenase AlkB [Salinicola sp. JS01]|uniref:alpha-ketoglutarate-dependent dioxygenase AlkB family protein n=1 Tax=Salinicola sp. JS01 TaxID=3050071 RepID=UPI00255B9CE7|nr:alpha-ketoglutarate-dependent dioxygenase AlkB [Salinicola sp. JS01]WIX34608.1 alpha-ketoglutarate-dependent dioxygenase AlkB [Salinicola sp. JS01]
MSAGATSREAWQWLETEPLLARLDAFIAPAAASALLETLLHEVAWESPAIRVYGRDHVIPRAQCWMGDPEASYRYSGSQLVPTAWHPAVAELAIRVQQALAQAELPTTEFNSVLLNRYHDGQQRMGWHSDDEPELGPDPIVAAVSLGAERPLRFRERRRGPGRRAFNVWLPHGSLLLMGPGVQSRWQHALAPRAIPGPRISLTFRRVHG